MTPDLKTSLEDLAEAEFAGAPVSTIDIGKARADGHRRVRTARLAPIGGGLAVAAACVLVVAGLGGTAPVKRDAGATGPAARHQFTGTDPLTAVAHFGYLPDGFQVAVHNTGPFYGSTVTAQTKPVPTGGAGNPMPVRLTVTTSAAEPAVPPFEKRKEVTVVGSPKAYLVTNPGDGPIVPADLSLQWQTASGSWFTLGGDYQIHGDALQTLLIKVAESVTTDASAVPLPIHIEGLPKGAVLGQAVLNDPAEVGQSGFQLGLAYTSGVNHSVFGISASPVGWNRPSFYIPVKVGSAQSNGEVCKDSEGLHICVQNTPVNKDDPLASVGGAQGLLDRITSLGTDPANWTTHVVN